MKNNLTAYIKDNTDIKKTYQSLNSRAKRITTITNVRNGLALLSLVSFAVACMPFIAVFCQSCAGPSEFHYFSFYFFIHYSLPVLFPIAATLLALVGAVYLVQRHYEQSFVKEMKNFIEGPKHEEREPGVGSLDVSSGNERVKPAAPSEQPESGYPLKASSGPNSNLDCALPPSNTARDVIQS